MKLEILCKYCNKNFLFTIPKSLLSEKDLDIKLRPNNFYKEFPVICRECGKEFTMNLEKKLASALLLRQEYQEKFLKEISIIYKKNCFLGGLLKKAFHLSYIVRSFIFDKNLYTDRKKIEDLITEKTKETKKTVDEIKDCACCEYLILCGVFSVMYAKYLSKDLIVEILEKEEE